MIGALDVIDRLPFEMQARLEADEFFSDIPVVVAEEGNIKLEMARKQAVITAKDGKRGVAVIVLQVVADDEYPNLAFGPMTLRVGFQVVENLELNRDANGTGKSARRIARRIRDVVKPLMLYGICTEFTPDKPCIAPVALGKELGELVRSYAVNFQTTEADSEGISLVETPQFAPYADTTPKFQITCGTDGATIYYTLDESFPSVQNPDAKVYVSPIDIPTAGLTVRAAAYLAGSVASQVNRASITAV